MNYYIRRTIENYVKTNGPQDTRQVIARFAKHFGKSKQCISGNLQCMKCIEGCINILSNKPHSIMY